MHSSFSELPEFLFYLFVFSFCIKSVISECNSAYCLNGGTCRDEPSGYKCDCRFGFYGKQCEGKFLVLSVHSMSLEGKDISSYFQNYVVQTRLKWCSHSIFS